jgi:hypothetical protein
MQQRKTLRSKSRSSKLSHHKLTSQKSNSLSKTLLKYKNSKKIFPDPGPSLPNKKSSTKAHSKVKGKTKKQKNPRNTNFLNSN